MQLRYEYENTQKNIEQKYEYIFIFVTLHVLRLCIYRFYLLDLMVPHKNNIPVLNIVHWLLSQLN